MRRCLVILCCFLARTEAQALAHAGKAAQLMQERRYTEADAEFEQSLAADPNNDSVRVQYATCLFIQERNADARKQFEMELKRLGEQPGLDYFLGQLDLRANDNRAAITKLAPLMNNPTFPKASFYLGLAYLAENREAEALKALELAATNNPRDPEAHYRLARIYSLKGLDDQAAQQYALYDQARETQRLVEGEGRACIDALRQKPATEARAICQKLADPSDSRRMLLLGQLYTTAAAFEDAVDPLKIAVQLEPSSFEGWQNLGTALFRLKRYQEALPALEKAANLNPKFFDTLNLLAATHHFLGDDKGALSILEQAHALNPEDQRIAAMLERLRASLGQQK